MIDSVTRTYEPVNQKPDPHYTPNGMTLGFVGLVLVIGGFVLFATNHDGSNLGWIGIAAFLLGLIIFSNLKLPPSDTPPRDW